MSDAIPPQPPTAGEVAADTPALTALCEAARAENQAAFRKVDTAGVFYTRWMGRRDCVTERHVNTWAHAGLVEITTRLACSTTTAEHYAELGTALREHLPKTRAAFAAGEIDYPKAWRIATATTGFSDAVVAAVEAKAVEIAGRYAPARFATELDALLIRTAPDEHAELRKDAEKWQRRIRRRNLGPLHRIEADLSPEEAAAVWQRVGEVAATVCEHDPRSKQHRLVDAYLAIMQGEDHLTCTCERQDCTADPTPASRRKPLVQITIDAQTLLGLRSEPAFLPGHGPIDPDLARRLARDATWQPILAELVDLAVTAGLLTPEHTGSEPTPQPHTEPTVEPEPVPTADAEPVQPAPAADAEPVEPAPATDAEPEIPASPAESALHARLCHPLLASFVARGTRRPSGYVPTCAPQPVLVPLTQADLYAEFTALLDAHSHLATGIHPDGHGGYADPPPGALTYRPSAEVAALVRARDRHCRFSHCSMPAERCQIDHITAFDHDDPIAGGWTIVSNLQCACAFHHELKTAGLWHARALPGSAILWTGPRGDRHLTLPAGGLTPVPAATDLTPDVGGGRAQTEPPEPEEPPPF